MRRAMIFACLFLVLASIETSVLWNFSSWIGVIPLLTIAGLLVILHVGGFEGFLWFGATAILERSVEPFLFGIIVVFLVKYIFSTRSFYALVGLGEVSVIMTSLMMYILAVFLGLFDVDVTKTSLHDTMVIAVILAPGLYLGHIFVVWLHRTILQLFLRQESHYEI